MTIDFTKENETLTVTLDGRLDSTTAGDLENFLEKELDDSTASLTFDFAGVDYISSKGLRILVATFKKMNGRPMTIANANDSVKEIMRLSGLLKVFNVA